MSASANMAMMNSSMMISLPGKLSLELLELFSLKNTLIILRVGVCYSCKKITWADQSTPSGGYPKAMISRQF